MRPRVTNISDGLQWDLQYNSIGMGLIWDDMHPITLLRSHSHDLKTINSDFTAEVVNESLCWLLVETCNNYQCCKI